MSETEPQSQQPKQEKKSVPNSLEYLNEILEEKLRVISERKQEGRDSTISEVLSDISMIYQGIKFFRDERKPLKDIVQTAKTKLVSNPMAWEDVLTQGAARVQQTVARHMREKIEEKLEVKTNTLKTILDVEEEEHQLAAARAGLEAVEKILQERRQGVLTPGNRIDIVDVGGSLKNDFEEARTKRQQAGQNSARSFIKKMFSKF